MWTISLAFSFLNLTARAKDSVCYWQKKSALEMFISDATDNTDSAIIFSQM